MGDVETPSLASRHKNQSQTQKKIRRTKGTNRKYGQVPGLNHEGTGYEMLDRTALSEINVK